jgi:transcription elongation factor S-II
MTDTIRNKVIDLVLQKKLLSHKDTKDLEKGIYNWAIDYADKNNIVKNWKNPTFKQIYIDKSRSVIANLDQSSYVKNSRLVERVKEKEFMPHDIPFMSADNVFPEMWRPLIEMKMKKDEKLGEMDLKPMTDQFKCGRCKKREIVYYEKQTRSADEPSTLFLYCLNCSHSWKM